MDNKMAIIGMIVFIILITLSLGAPLLTDNSPSLVDPTLKYAKPSREHLLGCDSAGRDAFARLLYGGRMSMLIGLSNTLLSGLVGIILGCCSGYLGKKVDATLLYISELFQSVPSNMLVMILVGFVGRGVQNLIIIFTLTNWSGIYSLTRLRILSLREEGYVQSCIANGVSRTSIMFRHLLPNTMGTILSTIATRTATFVLSEAGLSFLGLGVPLEVATWGNMLNSARNLQVFLQYPLLWVAHGVAITLFSLSINFFGTGLRDALDTRM